MNNYDETPNNIPLLGWQIEDIITEQLESMRTQIDEQAELIEGQKRQFMEMLAEKLAEKDARIQEQSILITKLQALVSHYESQLTQLKRRQFGSSSERSQPDSGQLSLLADFANLFGNTDTGTGTKPTIPPPPETEEITYKRKKRIGKREEDLSKLPIVRIEYELSEDERNCPTCETTMRDIGVTVRREIEIIPAQAIVKEHAVHAYACPNRKCEGTYPVRDSGVKAGSVTDDADADADVSGGNNVNKDNENRNNENRNNESRNNANLTNSDKLGGSEVIIRADSPKPLIAGSLASPSLVAHIAYQKYSNGMPLYRIEKGFRYDGVVMSRQNMSNWVISCVELYLISIYESLKARLLKEPILHSDATVVQVLREPGRSPQTKSCQWIHRTSGASDKKIVLYEYTQTKGAAHPRKFFENFTGYLHTDGADVYHKLKPDITIVGCLAHARRYFENIVKPMKDEERKNSEATTGLAYINALFKLERDFANLLTQGQMQEQAQEQMQEQAQEQMQEQHQPDYEKRHLLRLEKSKPIADAFFAWASDPKRAALPQSPLGKAIHYVLSQRKYLENVFLDGRLELSNNRCERSVKPFVMGRKAWLFSNTPEGAKASSVMYSIIETAKENGLHPFHYVKYLLETLPNSTTGDMATLLPWSDALPNWCRIS